MRPIAVAAVDPNETWEIDYIAELYRMRLERLEKLATEAKGAPERSDLEALAAEVRAQRDAYQPGTGPVFVVGWIPGAKRAVIEAIGRESIQGDDLRRRAGSDFEWQREMVRWAVRGHRNLRSAKGEVPFVSEPVDFDGRPRQVASAQTLDLYDASGILGELSILAARPQRLAETEKNG